MKAAALFLTLSFMVTSGLSFAAVTEKPKKKLKYIQEVLNRATVEEKKDLVKLLESIEVSPIQQKFKGQTVFKVRFVEKGSVFDRAGIETGDIVANGLPPERASEKE